MNIIVCIKKIHDPEIPPAKFKLDTQAGKVIPLEGIPPVINPFDEQAVELALRLKEKYGGKITAITIDNDADSSIIKHALALGADEGIILADQRFEGSDSFSLAYILGRAIRKIGHFDLVLCGRQAADWDEGLAGPAMAEILGLPLVTLAESITISEERLIVKRVILNGHQVLSIPIPALVTVSNEAGRPRLPSGWGIISASRKEFPVWKAEDIGADPSRIGEKAARRRLAKLYIPAQSRECEIISGETTEEAASELAERLAKAGII